MCFTLFSLGLGLCLCRAVTLTVVALIGGVGTQSLQLRAIECIQAPLQFAFSSHTFARNQQNATDSCRASDNPLRFPHFKKVFH